MPCHWQKTNRGTYSCENMFHNSIDPDNSKKNKIQDSNPLKKKNLQQIFCRKFLNVNCNGFVCFFFFCAGEIARQNKITQEILAKYLQRRLFPHLAHPPVQGSGLRTDRHAVRVDGQNDSDLDDALETVESERISNFQYYEGDDQGKSTLGCALFWKFSNFGATFRFLAQKLDQI